MLTKWICLHSRTEYKVRLCGGCPIYSGGGFKKEPLFFSIQLYLAYISHSLKMFLSSVFWTMSHSSVNKRLKTCAKLISHKMCGGNRRSGSKKSKALGQNWINPSTLISPKWCFTLQSFLITAHYKDMFSPSMSFLVSLLGFPSGLCFLYSAKSFSIHMLMIKNAYQGWNINGEYELQWKLSWEFVGEEPVHLTKLWIYISKWKAG